MNHIKCTKCNQIKPESAFYNKRNGGLLSWCKNCYCEKSNNTYKPKREEVAKRQTAKNKQMAEDLLKEMELINGCRQD